MIGEQYAKSSDLPEFMAAWGLRFSSHEVVGDLLNPTEVPVQDNQPPASLPVWISLTQFDDAQAATAGFDLVTLADAGYFTLAPGRHRPADADPAEKLSQKPRRWRPTKWEKWIRSTSATTSTPRAKCTPWRRWSKVIFARRSRTANRRHPRTGARPENLIPGSWG